MSYFLFLLLSGILTVNTLAYESGFLPVQVRNLGARIVNGQAASQGQFPWQVAIFGRSNVYPSYLCGGALISEEWVLTAGHCVDGAVSATIYYGTTKLSSSDRKSIQASDFILHENYTETYLTNDIGLIKLRRPLTFDNNTQAIKLAEEELDNDATVTISGWGQESDDDARPTSDTLNYIDGVNVISNSDCQKIYRQIVYPGLLCTAADGNPLKSPCLGDSGAPVVTNAETDPVHVAVFSFVSGYGCEVSYPSGNSRTAYFREWIREKTGI